MLYNPTKEASNVFLLQRPSNTAPSLSHTHTVLTTLSKMRSHTLWELRRRFISSYLSVPLFITASVYLQGPCTTALIFPALAHPALLSSLNFPHNDPVVLLHIAHFYSLCCLLPVSLSLCSRAASRLLWERVTHRWKGGSWVKEAARESARPAEEINKRKDTRKTQSVFVSKTSL